MNKTDWIPVIEEKPKGMPVVLMYVAAKDDYFIGIFQSEILGYPVTHWQQLVPPEEITLFDVPVVVTDKAVRLEGLSISFGDLSSYIAKWTIETTGKN